MAYDNTNRGRIRANDRKQSANHPDMKGVLNVAGVEYWLSGWNKTNDKGAYISLSVQAKDAAPVSQHSQAKADGYVKQDRPEVSAEELNDCIPWD